MNDKFYVQGSEETKSEYIRISESISRLTVSNLPKNNREISIKSDIFNYKKTQKGFYLLADTPMKGGAKVYFADKKDCEYIIDAVQIPAFGISAEKSYFVVSRGMPGSMKIVTGVKDGEFYIYPVYEPDGHGYYEDIVIDIIELPPYCTASDMANAYRKYQIEYNGFVPIAQREKGNKVLSALADSIEVRIRMGWKPVPSPVEEQTEENEPEMFVACTFDRVRELLSKMKKSGIEKANITLVGWNKGGHDGRWPQIFPVEEKLGGVDGLNRLIEYASSIGYTIAGHTNSTDAYTIANNLTKNDLLIQEDGENEKGYVWGGGRAYILCPEQALKIAEKELPAVKEAGFTGALYIDVLSAVQPKVCFDGKHMQTKRDCINNWKKILELSRKLFGAVGSEGGYTYVANSLDYVYYSYGKNDLFAETDEFFDIELPFWQMVYNGIILSNVYTETTNYAIKDIKTILKTIETNSRPTFYIYSKFMKNSFNDDWLGKEDLTILSDEDMEYTVSKLKEGYELYKKTSVLNRCFIEKYEIPEEGVRRVTFSNGSTITVNYNTDEYFLDIK